MGSKTHFNCFKVEREKSKKREENNPFFSGYYRQTETISFYLSNSQLPKERNSKMWPSFRVAKKLTASRWVWYLKLAFNLIETWIEIKINYKPLTWIFAWFTAGRWDWCQKSALNWIETWNINLWPGYLVAKKLTASRLDSYLKLDHTTQPPERWVLFLSRLYIWILYLFRVFVNISCQFIS